MRRQEYDLEYDEWKFIVKLIDFINLIEVYERKHSIENINQQKFSIFIVNQVLMLRKSFDATKSSINKDLKKKFVNTNFEKSFANFSTRRRERFKEK